ncbi:hypothetical protein B0H10DRAFT_2203737 [Mycena sp. CBHHK59/15]|nr:hypothetical protein B0H10DRAFT_2203737 [Mycena sp. CBHHK59/15]
MAGSIEDKMGGRTISMVWYSRSGGQRKVDQRQMRIANSNYRSCADQLSLVECLIANGAEMRREFLPVPPPFPGQKHHEREFPREGTARPCAPANFNASCEVLFVASSTANTLNMGIPVSVQHRLVLVDVGLPTWISNVGNGDPSGSPTYGWPQRHSRRSSEAACTARSRLPELGRAPRNRSTPRDGQTGVRASPGTWTLEQLADGDTHTEEWHNGRADGHVRAVAQGVGCTEAHGVLVQLQKI